MGYSDDDDSCNRNDSWGDVDFGIASSWPNIILSSSLIFLAITYMTVKHRHHKQSEYVLNQFKESNLANRTIVITGSNRGIGKATAEYMASKGANIILGDYLYVFMFW